MHIIDSIQEHFFFFKLLSAECRRTHLIINQRSQPLLLFSDKLDKLSSDISDSLANVADFLWIIT